VNARTRALAIPPEVKERVRERDGGACVYCGMTGDPVAHYIPRSQGGRGVEENILTLCPDCHRAYDTGPERAAMGDYFRRYLEERYPGWDELGLYYKRR